MSNAESAAGDRPGATRARHAKVIPSFVLSVLGRSLDSWVGKVQPAELLRWERTADLTESARRNMREAIVKRSRQHAERLWSLKVGVHLTSGWEAALQVTAEELTQSRGRTKVASWPK
jgi:hypothetical protein